MKHILAIEASTSACSVALQKGQSKLSRHQVTPRQHHALLLPMIEDMLAEAQLTLAQIDAVAYGCGPGSFTGLRIAASVTQGLALAHDIPVIPVSTLLTLAQTAYRQLNLIKIIPCLDARMNEIYWACCQLDTNKQIMTLGTAEYCSKHQLLIDQAQLEQQHKLWNGVGHGWQIKALQPYRDALITCYYDLYPNAYDLLSLLSHPFDRLPAEYALPRYLQTTRFRKATT